MKITTSTSFSARRHRRVVSGQQRSAAIVVVVLALAVVATACGASGNRATQGGQAPVRLTEVAADIGIGGTQAAKRLPPDCLYNDLWEGPPGCVGERMTGGVAVGDYDGDGRDDLYLTRLDGPDSLYRNNGDGTFTDVTREAGLDTFAVRSNGAGFADLTNDGFADLVVTTMAEDRHYLFINNGDGTFDEQAIERGVAIASDDPRGGFSVAFGDYDNDGWVDIHLTEWLDPNAHTLPSHSHARLLRNRGDAGPGFFDDVTIAAGVEVGRGVTDSTGLSEFSDPVVFSFASAFVDLDGDGWEDLIVAADYATTQLYWNNGDGTFTEGTGTSGIGTEGNAMGLAIGDLTGNGLPDVFISAINGRSVACDGRPCLEGMDGNRLYLNNGDRTFREAQDQAGVLDGAWGWGTAMLDMDNDGHLDLVLNNGVDLNLDEEFTEFHGLYRSTTKRLWHNQGQESPVFTEVALPAGLNVDVPGTGLAVLDFDNNGLVDIVMIHPHDTPTVWRNEGGTDNAWLRVAVTGAGPRDGGSNRDGLGAIVEVIAREGNEPQTRIVGVNSHFLGQSERVQHLGLGNADNLSNGTIHQVRVTFPASGRQVTINDVEPNQLLRVAEPAR